MEPVKEISNIKSEGGKIEFKVCELLEIDDSDEEEEEKTDEVTQETVI